MMKLIFYGILIYVLYKLIFDFIIPVSRATRQIRSRFREAQQQQQQYQQNRQHNEPIARPSSGEKKPGSDEEYIDFEEVK